jgi:hypothetical protein
MAINVRVQAYGPMFDGRAERAMAEAVDEAEQEIARQGADHLKHDLGAPPFQAPTGWYASHITEKKMGSLWAVWDTGVIYGPWLAGTGSKNWPVTRFRGYNHWRRLVTYLNRIAKPVTEKIINRAIARLGG